MNWTLRKSSDWRNGLHLLVEDGVSADPLWYCFIAELFAKSSHTTIVSLAGKDPEVGKVLLRLGCDINQNARAGTVSLINSVDLLSKDILMALEDVLDKISLSSTVILDGISLLTTVSQLSLSDVMRFVQKLTAKSSIVLLRVNSQMNLAEQLVRWMCRDTVRCWFLRPPPSSGTPLRQVHGEWAMYENFMGIKCAERMLFKSAESSVYVYDQTLAYSPAWPNL